MDPSDLENLDEEQLQQLMELGLIPDKQSALDRQYKFADALRGTALPEGRGNGRVYTASNPLETVGALMKQYAGMKQAKGLEQQQADLLKQQAQGRNLFLQKYLGMVPGVRRNNYDVTPGAPNQALIEALRPKV